MASGTIPRRTWRLRSFLRRVPAETNVGVALPSRSAESFDSFPPMQRYTEGVINHLCSERMAWLVITPTGHC
jgi:hypothetical protein